MFFWLPGGACHDSPSSSLEWVPVSLFHSFMTRTTSWMVVSGAANAFAVHVSVSTASISCCGRRHVVLSVPAALANRMNSYEVDGTVRTVIKALCSVRYAFRSSVVVAGPPSDNVCHNTLRHGVR